MSSGTVVPGLQDVLACESSICHIDGVAGKLHYRGYDIKDVARNLGFEDTAYLLWQGNLPSPNELSELDRQLREIRKVPEEVLGVLRTLGPDSDPVSALRAGISVWAAMHEARDSQGASDPATVARHLTAKMATMLAAIYRIRQGKEVVAPSEHLRHAGDLLYMSHGREPTRAEATALETVLVLYAEHELNASTFAARVTIGTQADPYSAVVAAISALKGPLHGGAASDVMDLLIDVGSPGQAYEWVSAAFAGKRKIPGFGHRVYRVEDPRATYLRTMALQLADQTSEHQWIDTALRIEEVVKGFKPLNANVDYFAAPVLYSLGFPQEFFTSLIASSRIAGWMAHIMEQYADNRLIRPRAVYRGEKDLPLSAR